MSRRAIVVALVALAVIALVVVVVKVANDDGDSGTAASGGALTEALARAKPAVAPFTGLTEVHAAIGDRCLRLAVADTEDERVAGLRDHTSDLGPYDGMVFVFQGQTQSAFTMSRVDDPLDIAFFDQDGTRDSSRAMAPCPDKADSECPVYRADGPYVYAVETKPGQLPSGALTACQPA